MLPKNIFSPHRVLAFTTVATGLAAFISGIVGVLPGTWANYALAGAGLLTKLVATVKFLDGNSKWELSPAGQSASAPVTHGVALVGQDSEPSDVDGAADAPVDVTPPSL